ncbi:MAG: glycine zipper domain-containing protein [Pseudomonadota bacterium]
MKEDKPRAKGETRRDIETPSDSLRDTIGAHPVGTSAGAVGGIAAGAAIGSAAGPVGSLAGAAVGAVAGAIAGGGIAEMVDPVEEDTYWRQNYTSRAYVSPGASYDDYGPAYRYGVDSYARLGPRRSWEEMENELGSGWDDVRGTSGLGWNEARHAARDSWQRVKEATERAIPGDSDRDGR